MTYKDVDFLNLYLKETSNIDNEVSAKVFSFYFVRDAIISSHKRLFLILILAEILEILRAKHVLNHAKTSFSEP